MKLCPQCAFIYEDHQGVCDMDGKQLVHYPPPVVTEQSSSPPTRLTIKLPARSESLPARAEELPAKRRSRRFPVLIIIGVVLATLLAVIYFAQLQRSPSSSAAHSPIQSTAPSAASDSSPQPSPADLISSTSGAVTPLPEQASEQVAEESSSSPANATAAGSTSPFSLSSQSPSSAASVSRARLASSPVSAGPGNNQGRVIVRLTNGATINADEAWEKREGVWYRQAGMVTFLKRSRVRTIERLGTSEPQPTINNGERRQKPETNSQNRLRIRQLEAVNTKKQSRVSSFLKMTGRILKKPFKL